MVTDKALLKEVTKELWQSVKKLRPGLPKEARTQLVLKALITIGDLASPIEAAMVVGVCVEMEEDDDSKGESEEGTSSKSANQSKQIEDLPEGRRTVRRRSAAE